MKKTPLFFLLILSFSFIAQAQKVDFSKQEFAFSNVVMKEYYNPFQYNIEFKFKIWGKYRKDQIKANDGASFPSYKINFFVTDNNGDTLNAASKNKNLRQSFSFFDSDTGKFKSYSPNHNITLSYSDFKQKETVFFSIWAQAESYDGKVKLDAFKAGTYKVNIPQLQPIEKQKIKIEKIIATENGKGITINIASIFSHSINELYADNESVDEVIFYADFTDSDGNPINTPNNPTLEANQKNESKYFTLSHLKNIVRNKELFFPYTDFYIPAGLQKIKYNIHAISHNYSMEWNNLASGEISINMPPIYFAKTVVKDIQVVEKPYDVAGKDIPILNFFITNKGSAGKGYPDLFWTFGTKDRKYIYTQKASNTFFAYNDSCSFQMLEDDLLYLNVYDHDMLSSNDFLGSHSFPKFVGEATYRSNIKNEDVIAGKIFFKRQLRPNANSITLNTKTTKHQGITGYQIWGNYKNGSGIISKIFLRTKSGTNETPKWTSMPIPTGADFSYFIPAWDLSKDAGFACIALDNYYQLPICQKYAAPEKYITESNDISIKANPFLITHRNGVNGILLKVDILYPEGFSNKNQLRFDYQFKGTNGSDLKRIIEKLIPETLPICPSLLCPMSVFIPFNVLYPFSSKTLHAHLTTNVSVKDGFLVGKSSDTLFAKIPTVSLLPKTQMGIDLKFAKNWSYVNITTRYGTQTQTFVKEKAEDGKKMLFDVIFPSEYACDDDMISIIITPYEFRTPLEEIKWEFKVADLKNGLLKLPKNKYAKNVFLKTH